MVCYHSPTDVGYYGNLGHGEVVRVKIPEKKFTEFLGVFFGLMDENGNRPDNLDKGGEYRHMIGIPGGNSSKLSDVLK